jgi:hypothetical protein
MAKPPQLNKTVRGIGAILALCRCPEPGLGPKMPLSYTKLCRTDHPVHVLYSAIAENWSIFKELTAHGRATAENLSL